MKKILVCLLVLCAMISLFSCVDDPYYTPERRSIVDETGEENDSPSGNTSSDQEETQKPALTIQEQVCFEALGVTVTAKSIEEDWLFGDGIKFLIENNGTKTYSVGIDEMIVNDLMQYPLFSAEVAPGKKKNETCTFSTGTLERAGIENIGKIEIYFYLYDSDSYETVYRAPCVTIETSLYEQRETKPDETGKVLYEEDGVRIIGKYVETGGLFGASVYLLIENGTDKNLTIDVDEMSVNGFMIEPLFYETVYAGKYAMDDITIFSSDLEENGIDTIRNVELVFRIIDENYTTVAISSPVTFSVG